MEEELDEGIAGTPAPGEGRPAVEAFGVGAVLQNALDVLGDQPLLVILAGLNAWIVRIVPAVVLRIITVATELGPSGATLPRELEEALPFALMLVLEIALFPLEVIVWTGGAVAVAHYVASDRADLARLYTSFPAAGRALLTLLLRALGISGLGFLWALLAGAAGAAGSLLVGPIVGLAVGAVAATVLAVPATWVGLGLFLSQWPAWLDGAWPAEALREGWRAARGVRLRLLLLVVLYGVVGFVSDCMCSFPRVLVDGMYIAGLTVSWLQYARTRSEIEEMPFFRRHPVPRG